MHKFVSIMFILFFATVSNADTIYYIPPENADAVQLIKERLNNVTSIKAQEASRIYKFCEQQESNSPYKQTSLQNCAALNPLDLQHIYDSLYELVSSGDIAACLAYSEISPAVAGKGIDKLIYSDWVSSWKKNAFDCLLANANTGDQMSILSLVKHYKLGILTPKNELKMLAWMKTLEIKSGKTIPGMQQQIESLSENEKLKVENLFDDISKNIM